MEDIKSYGVLLGMLLIGAAVVGMCNMQAEGAPAPTTPPALDTAPRQVEVPVVPEVVQPPPGKPLRQPDPEVEYLARILVSESGWLDTVHGTNANEGEAILLVLARRAHLTGWTLREAMERYSPRATGVRQARGPRGRWVQTLSITGRVPDGWPTQLPWYGRDGFLRRWKVRLAEAEDLLRWWGSDLEVMAELAEVTCGGVWPDHWGGAMDDHRALAEGWVRVQCGHTHNHFWVVPRLRSLRSAVPARAVTIPAEIARGD